MSVEKFELHVGVLEEAGYNQAMLGISLNKDQPIEKMPKVAEKLAFYDGGHNKFLEQIIIWLLIRAPRYWWQEADTFRLSSKSSQSTMHTILDNNLTVNNFELESLPEDILRHCNFLLKAKDLLALKRFLPEGFMQKRMWMMSYKTLRNIILQRRNHRLPHWRHFIKQILFQIQHPELLPKLGD